MTQPFLGYAASITSIGGKPILPKSKFVEYEESDLWWLRKYYGWKDSIPIIRWDFPLISSVFITPIEDGDYGFRRVQVSFTAHSISIQKG